MFCKYSSFEGILKRRFPYVVHMRNHLNNAVKVIMCCVVLHNMSITWVDELPEGAADPEDRDQPNDNVNQYYDAGYFNNLGRVQRRRLGQEARDNVRAQMDPNPTPRYIQV